MLLFSEYFLSTDVEIIGGMSTTAPSLCERWVSIHTIGFWLLFPCAAVAIQQLELALKGQSLQKLLDCTHFFFKIFLRIPPDPPALLIFLDIFSKPKMCSIWCMHVLFRCCSTLCTHTFETESRRKSKHIRIFLKETYGYLWMKAINLMLLWLKGFYPQLSVTFCSLLNKVITYNFSLKNLMYFNFDLHAACMWRRRFGML